MSDDKDTHADDADWGDAMAEQEASEVEQAPMEQLVDEAGEASKEEPLGVELDNAKLGVILDIPVSLSMEVGKTNIAIRNLLQLNQGSVIELDRLAGEPLDVMVNGTLIAHGEVVVVNEKFGIRLTDVMTPAERIKKLS